MKTDEQLGMVVHKYSKWYLKTYDTYLLSYFSVDTYLGFNHLRSTDAESISLEQLHTLAILFEVEAMKKVCPDGMERFGIPTKSWWMATRLLLEYWILVN